MKACLLLAVIINTVFCDNWAILVAGSNTYINYRHQADVFHAYQILRKNGFAQDRIITFAYDDIANDIKNPFRGKVFNRPTYQNIGIDVYAGVVIDYKSFHVDPTIFLDVLQGNKRAVAHAGSGRVLQSTSEDNVFLYFADHGAPGLIAFPSQYLYAKDLLTAFNKIKGKYNKLVFYLETCQSGSMFPSLPNNTRVYALSAAGVSEPSWATYCAPSDVVQGKHIGSCLGDLFSVNFLQSTQENDIFNMDLNEQFLIIRQKTTQSRVMQWGDLSFKTDKVSQFLSYKKGQAYRFKYKFHQISQLRKQWRQQKQIVNFNSRTVKVQTLAAIFSREESLESWKQLKQQIQSMRFYDQYFMRFIDKFGNIIKEQYNAQNIDYDCLKQSIDYFEYLNGKFSDYGLGFVKYFVKGCQMKEAKEIIKLILEISSNK